MADMMTFPDTVEEFMEQYKIVDTEQVYTNGTELVPIFRMRQWFEHLKPCEDAVSREAVHTVIEEVLYETTKGADNWYGLLNDDVRTLPPVTPKTEQRWIPCSERLPDESGEYLCTLVGVHSIGLPTECGYELPNRGMISGWSTCEADGFKFLRDDEVIAWMPLPEPYREEGEK